MPNRLGGKENADLVYFFVRCHHGGRGCGMYLNTMVVTQAESRKDGMGQADSILQCQEPFGRGEQAKAKANKKSLNGQTIQAFFRNELT